MTAARIASIDIFRADLPLAEPFEHASSGLVDQLQEIVVKLTAQDGAVGYGEMRGNVPYVTGETPGRVVAALTENLAPRLVQAGLGAPAQIVAFMDRALVGNSTAKAVIDLAVHDLTARRLGVPVQTLLGGGAAETIRFHGTLPFCPPEEAAQRAAAYLDAGVAKIKVRVGLRPYGRDVARMEAIRGGLDTHPAGKDALLAVDANQGWAPKEAIRTLRLLERFDLAWIEQPVPAGDLAGMRAVKQAVAAPVIADEFLRQSARPPRSHQGRGRRRFPLQALQGGRHPQADGHGRHGRGGGASLYDRADGRGHAGDRRGPALRRRLQSLLLRALGIPARRLAALLGTSGEGRHHRPPRIARLRGRGR